MQQHKDEYLIAGKPLTTQRLQEAVWKVIQNQFWFSENQESADLQEYANRIGCFGEIVHPLWTLLNILSAASGSGKYSFKNRLLQQLGYPFFFKDVNCQRRIEKLRMDLEDCMMRAYSDRLAKIISDNSQKMGACVYLDRYRLARSNITKPNLKIIIEPENPDNHIPHPWKMQLAALHLFRIITNNPYLARDILNQLFGIWIYESCLPALKDGLSVFVNYFFRENIHNPGSALYILTRKYWDTLSKEIAPLCPGNDWILLQKHMQLFNPPEDIWIVYPQIVVDFLEKLAFKHAHPGLQSCVAILLLNHKPYRLSEMPQSPKLLYQKAVMGKFLTLAWQIEPANTLLPELYKTKELMSYSRSWYGYVYRENWVTDSILLGLKLHANNNYYRFPLHPDETLFYCNHLDKAIQKGDAQTVHCILSWLEDWQNRHKEHKPKYKLRMEHFLCNAAMYKQHDLVWMIGRRLHADFSLSKLIGLLDKIPNIEPVRAIFVQQQFMMEYGYLYQIAKQAELPIEVRATIFGFFKALGPVVEEKKPEKPPYVICPLT